MDLNTGYILDVESRLKTVIWIIILFFLLVVSRLFYLQVVKGSYYKIFSEKNSIREIKVPAARGIIFDKNGQVIVENKPVYDLVVIPQYITNKEVMLQTVNHLFAADPEEIERGIEKTGNSSFLPVMIKQNVPFDTVSKLKTRKTPFNTETGYNLDGVDIINRYDRVYSDGFALSHALGYVGEINQDQLDQLNAKYPGRYKKGDYVGIGGIEQEWDGLIRGVDGYSQKVVDAVGREITNQDMELELGDSAVQNGNDLFLTIDFDLQKKASELLKDKGGALVAIDPVTGATLAIYSSPSYDLNKLNSSERSAYWLELSSGEDKPLYNRAIQGIYPPASTYKAVTALAALEEGVITDEEKINCGGGLKFGNRTFGCWNKSGHGPVNILEAIAQSCDVFFYTMGMRLGVDKLAHYAHLLGLGSVTAIGLPGEKKGLVPTVDWKMKIKGRPWGGGETLSVAIGQGYNLVTPLQVALMASRVANGGLGVRPYLVEKVVGGTGEVIYQHNSQPERIRGIAEKNIDTVRKGLVDVVESPRGTAGRLKALKLKIAGKTGTAQVVSRDSETGAQKHKSHAWFFGFAPYDDPKIAIAAIVEHGEHGSSAAAPIVGELIKVYLKKVNYVVGNN